MQLSRLMGLLLVVIVWFLVGFGIIVPIACFQGSSLYTYIANLFQVFEYHYEYEFPLVFQRAH